MRREVIDYRKQIEGPLFPDVFWNQPVNKRAAGKLLLIGGHSQQFSRIQQLYLRTKRAGIGEVKFAMPDAIRVLMGSSPEGEFLPSTPSGSFAASGADTAIRIANDFDGVLLGGEFSTNSETVRFLEMFITETEIPIMATGEVLETLLPLPTPRDRLDLVIATPLQLSRWAKELHIPIYVTSPNLQKEIALTQQLNEQTGAAIISNSMKHCVATAENQTSMTPLNGDRELAVEASAAVFYLQHPKRFEAITSGIWQAQELS